MLILLRDIFHDPHGVARSLRRDATVFGLAGVEVLHVEPSMVWFRMQLDPWLSMAEAGYPREQLLIQISRDGNVFAIPDDGGGRRWKHRFPPPTGQLCLWDPKDPRDQRWEWEDGLAKYVTIAHRHLMTEECWRRASVWCRNGDAAWPGIEAPHGGGDGKV